MSAETFKGWAILELMGHRRLAGYVTEEEIAGAGMIRIDVPGEDGEMVATQYYSPSALYCLSPVTEELARAVARNNQPTPVTRYELPPVRSREDPPDAHELDAEIDHEIDEMEF